MLPLDPISPPTPLAQPQFVPAPPSIPFEIRSYAPADLAACRHLYTDGLLGGKLADNDTGFDIDDIAAAYMKPGSHFWVAQTEGNIVGMIGVQHHGDGVGEIRRLRVLEPYRRRGIGSGLVEAAVRFCNEQGYLKVTLDTFVDHEPAIKLFQKFHFHLSRTKRLGDRDLLYFYLDLYGGEKQKPT